MRFCPAVPKGLSPNTLLLFSTFCSLLTVSFTTRKKKGLNLRTRPGQIFTSIHSPVLLLVAKQLEDELTLGLGCETMAMARYSRQGGYSSNWMHSFRRMSLATEIRTMHPPPFQSPAGNSATGYEIARRHHLSSLPGVSSALDP